MTKAEQLKALVARLVNLKSQAVPPTEAWAAPVAERGTIEVKRDGLRIWYYDPETPGAQPLGIEVRDREKMTLVLRVYCEHDGSNATATSWKRGEWEHAIINMKATARESL